MGGGFSSGESPPPASATLTDSCQSPQAHASIIHPSQVLSGQGQPGAPRSDGTGRVSRFGAGAQKPALTMDGLKVILKLPQRSRTERALKDGNEAASQDVLPPSKRKRVPSKHNSPSPGQGCGSEDEENKPKVEDKEGSWKKQLLDIITKLQKKDLYGVFSEPVNEEEVPDYHTIIKNPMDFGTMRTRVETGQYESWDSFRGDAELVCKNAMHYNASTTIYYKQAKSIKDMLGKIMKGVDTTQHRAPAQKGINGLGQTVRILPPKPRSFVKSRAGVVTRRPANKRQRTDPVGDWSELATADKAREGAVPLGARESGEGMAIPAPRSSGGGTRRAVKLPPDAHLRRGTYAAWKKEAAQEQASIVLRVQPEIAQLSQKFAYHKSILQFTREMGDHSTALATNKVLHALPPALLMGTSKKQTATSSKQAKAVLKAPGPLQAHSGAAPSAGAPPGAQGPQGGLLMMPSAAATAARAQVMSPERGKAAEAGRPGQGNVPLQPQQQQQFAQPGVARAAAGQAPGLAAAGDGALAGRGHPGFGGQQPATAADVAAAAKTAPAWLKAAVMSAMGQAGEVGQQHRSPSPQQQFQQLQRQLSQQSDQQQQQQQQQLQQRQQLQQQHFQQQQQQAASQHQQFRQGQQSMLQVPIQNASPLRPASQDMTANLAGQKDLSPFAVQQAMRQQQQGNAMLLQQQQQGQGQSAPQQQLNSLLQMQKALASKNQLSPDGAGQGDQNALQAQAENQIQQILQGQQRKLQGQPQMQQGQQQLPQAQQQLQQGQQQLQQGQQQSWQQQQQQQMQQRSQQVAAGAMHQGFGGSQELLQKAVLSNLQNQMMMQQQQQQRLQNHAQQQAQQQLQQQRVQQQGLQSSQNFQQQQALQQQQQQLRHKQLLQIQQQRLQIQQQQMAQQQQQQQRTLQQGQQQQQHPPQPEQKQQQQKQIQQQQQLAQQQQQRPQPQQPSTQPQQQQARPQQGQGGQMQMGQQQLQQQQQRVHPPAQQPSQGQPRVSLSSAAGPGTGVPAAGIAHPSAPGHGTGGVAPGAGKQGKAGAAGNLSAGGAPATPPKMQQPSETSQTAAMQQAGARQKKPQGVPEVAPSGVSAAAAPVQTQGAVPRGVTHIQQGFGMPSLAMQQAAAQMNAAVQVGAAAQRGATGAGVPVMGFQAGQVLNRSPQVLPWVGGAPHFAASPQLAYQQRFRAGMQGGMQFSASNGGFVQQFSLPGANAPAAWSVPQAGVKQSPVKGKVRKDG